MRYYKLNDHTPVPCDRDDPELIHLLTTTKNRQVAYTEVGDIAVSTVFLWIDPGWDQGKPILFETMMFKVDWECLDYQERYTTWEAAEAGHARAVASLGVNMNLTKS